MGHPTRANMVAQKKHVNQSEQKSEQMLGNVWYRQQLEPLISTRLTCPAWVRTPNTQVSAAIKAPSQTDRCNNRLCGQREAASPGWPHPITAEWGNSKMSLLWALPYKEAPRVIVHHPHPSSNRNQNTWKGSNANRANTVSVFSLQDEASSDDVILNMFYFILYLVPPQSTEITICVRQCLPHSEVQLDVCCLDIAPVARWKETEKQNLYATRCLSSPLLTGWSGNGYDCSLIDRKWMKITALI